jgi:hypothetical protein
VVAADAGLMEIEWEETAVWSVAETVRQSTAEDAGNGLGQESIVEEALKKLRMEFCSALRRRETEHAERRAGFGLERGVSCGRSEQRWRTKLDFCSRKSFDDHHRSTTLGTTPETVRVSGILICLRFLCRAKQVKT